MNHNTKGNLRNWNQYHRHDEKNNSRTLFNYNCCVHIHKRQFKTRKCILQVSSWGLKLLSLSRLTLASCVSYNNLQNKNQILIFVLLLTFELCKWKNKPSELKKELRGRLIRGTCILCVRGLPLSLCRAGVSSSLDTSVKTHPLPLTTLYFKGLVNHFSLYFFFHYYKFCSFLPPPTMIVCSRNNCECRMKLCPEEEQNGFVKVTKLKMIKMIQLNKKRLNNNNFKTYYYLTSPRTLGQYQNIKMIFCKRRIGATNFSGYYNRKRARRWPFFL